MRFNTPIYFQKIDKPGGYNQRTGNYDDDTIIEVKKYADVTSAGIETLKLMYGDIKQGSLVIRLQNHYKEPFDYIRIGDKQYKQEHKQPLRVKQTFIVSEVP